MQSSRSSSQWREYVQNCLDFRPDEGIYRVARAMFTEPELFDIEMEYIFEKAWIFACHESQLPKPHDFLTMQAGRQPMIISRGADGQLNAMVNACQHRGATVTRLAKGNQSTFTCPFHAWCYKSDGKLVKVKDPSEYEADFDKSTRGLRKARIASYRGFVFISLDAQATDSLESYLGDAKTFIDMVVDQSPTGELEVVPGRSTYTYDGNWKLQNENGLDGYHVSTVHYNYVSTVQHRNTVVAKQSGSSAGIIDLSKMGAGAGNADEGWFTFEHGHSVLFSASPNPEVRPGYLAVMPRLVEEYGRGRAEWMMHRMRNLNLYPNLFLMDAISSQLRIIRPVAWNKTEIVSMCIAVKGESAQAREARIRQFEDFFNVSGMGTPDDLVEFAEAQRGFEGRLELWNDISRGKESWHNEPTDDTRLIGVTPVLTGNELTQEGLFVNQHRTWQQSLLSGLSGKQAAQEEVAQ